MDHERSRQYLAALDIPVWRSRLVVPQAADPGDLAPDPLVAEVLPAAPTSPQPIVAAARLKTPPGQVETAISPPAGRTSTAARAPTRPSAAAMDQEPPPWLDDVPPDEPAPPWFDAAEVDPDDWGLVVPEPAVPVPVNPIATMDWAALAAAVADCRACGLCAGRTRTVFGVGDPNAALMFIGEGPGQDEDRTGEPFVGRAGQLLNRMLAAIGLTREQVYIANVVKCRPPGNRNPNPDEAAACRGYLERQIALVAPRLLVSLGAVSATALLGQAAPVGQLRGRLHVYRGPVGQVPLIVTYHPSYYLRSPAQKAHGWQDLQRIVQQLAGREAAART